MSAATIIEIEHMTKVFYTDEIETHALSGVHLTIDLPQVDPRFHGDLSLHFPMTLPNDVVAALPSRSLAFPVSAEYAFHMLGVRARP